MKRLSAILLICLATFGGQAKAQQQIVKTENTDEFLMIQGKDTSWINGKAGTRRLRRDGVMVVENIRQQSIRPMPKVMETTLPDTVKTLDLTRRGLKDIPPRVYDFKNLEKLTLSFNEFTTLPEDLTQRLPKLQKLFIDNNKLSNINFRRNKRLTLLNLQSNGLFEIPKSITKNKALTQLLIGNNPIPSLQPSTLRKLKKVQVLNLYACKLTALPKQINKLKALLEIDLYHNQLKALPPQFTKLSRLETLAIANNKIEQLPENLGDMKHLRRLYCHHNKLSELPASLQKLDNLILLDINTNWFNQLPEVVLSLHNLEELNLRSNNIHRLPEALLKLQQIKEIDVVNNPFQKDPHVRQEYVKVMDTLMQRDVRIFQ